MARDARGRFIKGSGSVKDIDRGMKKIVKEMFGVGKVAHVGIQGDEAAAEHEGSELSNVQLGMVHEFGAPEVGIPERSFLRDTFDDNEEKYARMLDRGAKKILGGQSNQDTVVGLVGEQMVSDMKRRINEGIDPPNEDATVAAKGSSKPLIDTGALKNSITYKVTDEHEAKDFNTDV